MDVSGKLVELLRKAPHLDVVKGYKGNDCTFKQGADWLIANGVTVLPETGIGDMSDGYHTFNELYHHRAVLFSVICNLHPLCSWKAKKHHDGTMYDGMFIVGINTPEGQATYHYDIDPYWDMFKVPEADFAPEWDGHTADEVIRRIALLGTDGTDSNISTKWISVKDRLPEFCVAVLAYAKYYVSVRYEPTVVRWTGDYWCDATGIRMQVTHWMPLPQPPKGE